LMMKYGYDPHLSEGSLKCPIFQTSTFVFKSAEDGKAFFELAYGLRKARGHEELGLIYSRLNNPDLEILEDRLALWDEADACAVFNSGMAAISTTLLALVHPGSVVAYSTPIYGGTDHLLRAILPQMGVECVPFFAVGGAKGLEAALSRAKAKGKLTALLLETPANPTNSLVDIEACGDVARAFAGPDGAAVLVDNTFLGPLFQQPLHHGADLVLYSATKFIGGHSDLIAGACCGKAEIVARVRAMRTFLGTITDAWTGWLLMRSLETLKLRMTCQMKNARHVADALADHPKVKRVYYLGHLKEDEPQWALYRKQCKAPGSVISFDLHGGEAECFRMLNALRLVSLAVSLGGTESLAQHPATMTHADVAHADQEKMGITTSMIRMSVGVENPEDLIADLEQALAKV
jgi:methionine-gamma-lyase